MSKAALWTCLIVLAGCHVPTSSSRPTRDLTALRSLPLHAFSEPDVDAYLRWLSAQPWTRSQRVAHLARKTIGQPYRLSLLGEFPYELIDPDPTYCLGESDCVTFVEQTLAMAIAEDWSGFYRTLQRLRYREGEVGFRTRNHFIEADWNPNNRWLLDDVTDALHPEAAEKMVTRVDRAAFLRRAGLASDEPALVLEGFFIPRDRLVLVAAELQNADLIQFVRSSHGNQFVGHLGFVLHDATGPPILIHSGKPAVAELPLAKYLEAHPQFIGFKILRLHDRTGPPGVIAPATSAPST